MSTLKEYSRVRCPIEWIFLWRQGQVVRILVRITSVSVKCQLADTFADVVQTVVLVVLTVLVDSRLVGFGFGFLIPRLVESLRSPVTMLRLVIGVLL